MVLFLLLTSVRHLQIYSVPVGPLYVIQQPITPS